MKFIIARETILPPLQLVAGVVEKRQTLPVLSNILIEAKNNQLFLTGTDLEVELVGFVELQEIIEEGEITVPGKKLLEICRSLSDGAQIEISVEGTHLLVRSGRSRFSLSTLPATEFPKVDNVEGENTFAINQDVLRKAIDNTSFAMAQQDVRYYLNGMLFEVNNSSLRTVATDGHRLATSVANISGPEATQQIILPRKGVIELAKLLSDAEATVSITLTDNHLRAQTDKYTFISKLVDGKFPDYTRVIPKGGNNILIADRTELRQMFARAAILSNEKYRGVRLVLEPGLVKVLANNPEQEEAEESLSVDYQGDSIEMGFNVSYLQDVMGALDTQNVKLTLSDANSSALLEEPDSSNTIYVIMPMRL